MADIFDKEKRHEIMSHIGAKDTQPELLVRRYLYSNGIKYRLNDRRFTGRPDLYIPRAKLAVFINGCFWHAHDDCKIFRVPKTNVEFWTAKFAGNKERDARKIMELEAEGIRTFVIWECQLSPAQRMATLEKLLDLINDLSRFQKGMNKRNQ